MLPTCSLRLTCKPVSGRWAVVIPPASSVSQCIADLNRVSLCARRPRPIVPVHCWAICIREISGWRWNVNIHEGSNIMPRRKNSNPLIVRRYGKHVKRRQTNTPIFCAIGTGVTVLSVRQCSVTRGSLAPRGHWPPGHWALVVSVLPSC